MPLKITQHYRVYKSHKSISRRSQKNYKKEEKHTSHSGVLLNSERDSYIKSFLIHIKFTFATSFDASQLQYSMLLQKCVHILDTPVTITVTNIVTFSPYRQMDTLTVYLLEMTLRDQAYLFLKSSTKKHLLVRFHVWVHELIQSFFLTAIFTFYCRSQCLND